VDERSTPPALTARNAQIPAGRAGVTCVSRMGYSPAMKPILHFYRERRGRPDPTQEVAPCADELWLEQALGGAWVAALRVVPQGATFVVAEVRIFPDSPARGPGKRDPGRWSERPEDVPSGGLPARRLREVHLDAARAQTREIVAYLRGRLGDEYVLGEGGLLARFGFDQRLLYAKTTRRGRPGADPLALAELAQQYLVKCGESTKPVQELARDRGEKVARTRELLRRAASQGLLVRRGRGQAGGQLGREAQGLLDELGDP
jgi:hypothetical protein